jgi:branched-chain amino acid transport system ATP-binding protein
MLEVEKVNVFYGQLQALRDVSLKVHDGELVVLFGPNGHGKSTLLKTICGLLTPASGTVKWNGKELTKVPAQKIVEMGVVYIAEERHLFPDMTVLDNLTLGAYNANARKQRAKNLEYVFHWFQESAGQDSERW